MAQINIKPNRLVLISAIEKALSRMEQEDKDLKAAHKQYESDFEAWAESADLSDSNIRTSVIKVNHRDDKPEGVYVVLKKYPVGKPKRVETPYIDGWKRTEAKEDMRATVNMLKLSEEETVNASVANKVAKYL